MKQSNKKPSEIIKEEPLKNKRPKSANNPTKYTDKEENIALDTKHKKINKKLKDKKFEVYEIFTVTPESYDSTFCVQELTKNSITKEQELKYEQTGNFNVFYKFDEQIGITIPKEQKLVKNSDFNNIFVTSLLEICGEKTIDSGKEQTNIYVDLAKNDLWYEMEHILDKHGIVFSIDGLEKMIEEQTFNKLNGQELTQLKYFLFTDLFRTDNFFEEYEYFLDNSVIRNFLSNNLKEQKELSFVSRLLCKIFLFQMFDRKPENVVVMEDEDGKMDFCEIDFDDNYNITDDDKKKKPTSVIFFTMFTDNKNSKAKEKIKYMFRTHLKYLYDEYVKDIILSREDMKKSFAKMIKNYTMTSTKIEELIKKTALKAKYMGLSEQEVIDGINEKMKLWKEMLNDKKNGDVVNQIEGIKEAREQTLKALKKITKEKVAEIVHKIMMMHDLAYDKPDERKIKDDNDVVKDYIMKDFKLSNEEVNKHLTMRRKDNIKRFQEQQVTNATKIQSRFRSMLARNKVKKIKEEQNRIIEKEKQNKERIKRDYKTIKLSGNVPMKFTKVNFNKIKEIIEEANKKKNKNKTQNKKSKKNTKTLNQGNKKGF